MWYLVTGFCQRPQFEEKVHSGAIVSFLYPLITLWGMEREHYPEMG